MWQVTDARPLVRSISCWALSRYAHWLAQRATQPGSGAAQLDEVLRVRALIVAEPGTLPCTGRSW